MEKLKNLLLVLLLGAMLLGVAIAVPSGTVSDEAIDQYLEEGADDAYDFL